LAAGTNPFSVTIEPTGKLFYAANSCGASISASTIKPTTGALAVARGSPFPEGKSLQAIAIDPTEMFVYVANHVGNNISAQ
jgi:DNA-binding beta-propeller fold protein YncE